jgi:hypothetical protein
MSGTPGEVSLSSTSDRLFNMPNHASVWLCARKSRRNRLRPDAVSNLDTKFSTAAS